MKKKFVSIRMFIWMTLLTGVLYPLVVTVIAQTTMKSKAEGQWISFQGRILGSSLIGQKFDSERYFWGRPSAVDYNPMPSGGSNLGPTSMKLKTTVAERKQRLMRSHENPKEEVPSELLFASGSGLDPHIHLETAYFQVDRIAKARQMEPQQLKHIIDVLSSRQLFQFLRDPIVNVLVLNITLDEFSENSTEAKP